MNDNAKAKSGWGELGPKWITAIATLITALAGAGFFLGRSTAPERGGPDPDAEHATTVTVTVPDRDERVTGGPNPPKQGDVRWKGELTFPNDGTGFNFDLVPPNFTAGRFVEIWLDALQVHGDAATVTVWKSGGVPDEEACAVAVEEDGGTRISTVVKDNQVCGRTYEGRIFRMTILSTDGPVRADVVVWE
ncbi:hypothetical protein [Saccharomonospora sp. NB11]|jgi:hypothetical protein|uniref:hypothetical protein n=1 Tax=Saccharomonospora sp. NB11 TaxID=1642298 RepID=UPI0018D1D06D|nr:hypothetical protein [Saccharomonospora sp. NB11]